MQMATSIETDNGEMIVKRVSVPMGLEELMEGLTKEVMLKKPKDIYVFASQYFANLLDLREKGVIKGISGKKTQSVSKHILGDGVDRHLKKKTKSIEPVKHLTKQISIRSESPVKKAISAKKISLTPKEEKTDKTKSFLDKRKARKGSKDSNGSDKQTSTTDKSEKKTRERSVSDGRKSKSDSGSVKTTPRQQNQTKTSQEKSSKGSKKPVEKVKVQEDNANKKKSKEIETESLAKAGGILQTSKSKIDDVEQITVKDETVTEGGSVCVGCTLKDKGAVDLTKKEESKPENDKEKENLYENSEKTEIILDRSVDEVDSKKDDKIEATSGEIKKEQDDRKTEADNEIAKETSSKEETSIHENDKEKELKSETPTDQEIIRSKRSISVDAGNVGENKAEQLTQQKSFDSAQLHEEVKQVSEEMSGTNFKTSFNPYQLRQEIKKASEEGKFEDETKFDKIASEVRAAIKIQSIWRGFSVRKNKNRNDLQKETPSLVNGEKIETITGREESKEEKHKDEIARAVMKIQALWRGFKIRKHLQNTKLFGSTIESPVKREETLKDINKIDLEKAASLIQAVWRGFKVRKNIRAVDERLKELQAPEECDEMPHQRGLSDEDIHKAATKIQAGVRGYMVRKEKRNNNRLNSITEDPLEEVLQEEKESEGLINTGELHDRIIIEEKGKHKTSETIRGTSSSDPSDNKANMNLNETESGKTNSAKEKSQSDKTESLTDDVTAGNEQKEISEKNSNEKLVNEATEKEEISSVKDEHFDNKMKEVINKNTKEADKENIDMKIAEKLLETPLKMSTQNILNKESDSKSAEDSKHTKDIGVEQIDDKEIHKSVELGETGNQLSKNKSDDTEEDNKKTENQVEFIAPELNFPTTNKLSSSDTSEIIDDSISKNIVNKDDAGPISFPDYEESNYEAAPTRPVTSDVLKEWAQENKGPNNDEIVQKGNGSSLKTQERILNEESSTSVDSMKTVILNGTLGSTESTSDTDVKEKKLKSEKTKDRLESEENRDKGTVIGLGETQLKHDKIEDQLENENNKFDITKMEQKTEETVKCNEGPTNSLKKEDMGSTSVQFGEQSDKEKNLKETETELSTKLNKRDNVKLSDTHLMHSGEFHDVLPFVGSQEEPLSKENPPKEVLENTNIRLKSPSGLVNTGELHDSVLIKEKENKQILKEIGSSLVAQDSDQANILPKESVDLFKDNSITANSTKENFINSIGKEIAKQNEEINKEITLPSETLNKTISREENIDYKAVGTKNENEDKTENDKNKEESTGESKIRQKRSVDPLTQNLNQPQDNDLVTELSKDKGSTENNEIEQDNNKNKLNNEEIKKEHTTTTATLTSSSDQKKQEIDIETKLLETDIDKSQTQDIEGATKLSNKLASEVSNKNPDDFKTESNKEMTVDNDKQQEIKKDIDLPTELPNEKNTLANNELAEHDQAEIIEAKIKEKDLTECDRKLTEKEAKKSDTSNVESLKEADMNTRSEQEPKTGDNIINTEKKVEEQVSPIKNLVSTSELHDGVVIETSATLSEPNQIMNQIQKTEEKTAGEAAKQVQGLINSSELHDGVPIDKSINEPQSKINAGDTHSSLQESKLDLPIDILKSETTDKKNETVIGENKIHSTAVSEEEKLSTITAADDTSKNSDAADNKEQNNISNDIILSVADKVHDKSENKIQETENKEINKLSLDKDDKIPETLQEVTESLVKESKLPLESTTPTIPSDNQEKRAVNNEESTTVDKHHGKEEQNTLLSNGKHSDESSDIDNADVKREQKMTEFTGNENKIINSEDIPSAYTVKKDSFEVTSRENGLISNGSKSENISNDKPNEDEEVKDDTNKTGFDMSALKKEIASYTKDPLDGIDTITNGHKFHEKKEETENVINSLKDNEMINHKLNTEDLKMEIMKSNEQLKEMIMENKSKNLLEKIDMGKSETSPDISTTDETITESTLSTLSSNSESNKLNIQQLNEEIKNKLSQQANREELKVETAPSQTSMRKLSDIKEENPNLKLSIESADSLESESTNNESHKDPEGTIEIDEPSKKQLDGIETVKVESDREKFSANKDQEVSINKENGEMEHPSPPTTVEIKEESTIQTPSKPSNQNQKNAPVKTPSPTQITIGGDDSVHISGTNVTLVHSGELHDTISVPVSITPPQKPSSPESPPKTDSKTPPQGLVSSGELHDNVVPLSVQLNEAAPAGAEVLTSHVSESVGGRAQASNKDASTCEARSDTETSSPISMETEKRNNASLPKKSMEVEAATKIQAGFRGYQVRKQLKNKNSASGDISNQRRSTRRKSSGRITESGRINNKVKNSSDLEEKSAVKIQAGVRGFLVRRRQKKQKQGKESA